jgi:hypothetical protein
MSARYCVRRLSQPSVLPSEGLASLGPTLQYTLCLHHCLDPVYGWMLLSGLAYKRWCQTFFSVTTTTCLHVMRLGVSPCPGRGFACITYTHPPHMCIYLSCSILHCTDGTHILSAMTCSATTVHVFRRPIGAYRICISELLFIPSRRCGRQRNQGRWPVFHPATPHTCKHACKGARRELPRREPPRAEGRGIGPLHFRTSIYKLLEHDMTVQ